MKKILTTAILGTILLSGCATNNLDSAEQYDKFSTKYENLKAINITNSKVMNKMIEKNQRNMFYTEEYIELNLKDSNSNLSEYTAEKLLLRYLNENRLEYVEKMASRRGIQSGHLIHSQLKRMNDGQGLIDLSNLEELDKETNKTKEVYYRTDNTQDAVAMVWQFKQEAMSLRNTRENRLGTNINNFNVSFSAVYDNENKMLKGFKVYIGADCKVSTNSSAMTEKGYQRVGAEAQESTVCFLKDSREGGSPLTDFLETYTVIKNDIKDLKFLKNSNASKQTVNKEKGLF